MSDFWLGFSVGASAVVVLMFFVFIVLTWTAKVVDGGDGG